MSEARAIDIRREEESYSMQVKALEKHLHNIQQESEKTGSIDLVINKVIDTSERHPKVRTLNCKLTGALLEHVREIVRCLKVNPQYKRYIAKQNPVFERWSPGLEIRKTSGLEKDITAEMGGMSSYYILADEIGPYATSRYYLDKQKTLELRLIFRLIWESKTGEEAPPVW